MGISLRDRDLEALKSSFRRFPGIREVRIFGSRATGTAKRASDIDLAISAPEVTPAQWAELCENIESAPLIYEIDIVRPETISNPRLLEKISSEGIAIYPP